MGQCLECACTWTAASHVRRDQRLLDKQSTGTVRQQSGRTSDAAVSSVDASPTRFQDASPVKRWSTKSSLSLGQVDVGSTSTGPDRSPSQVTEDSLRKIRDFAGGVAGRLQDRDPDMRRAALRSLERLLATLKDPKLAPEEVVRHLEVFEKLPRPVLAKFKFARCPDGDMMLHIAAKNGRLDLCRSLVEVGSLVAVKNSLGLSPADLARNADHTQVSDYLAGFKSVTSMRGGSGDAFAPAQADYRSIVQVEWYCLELPGYAGRFLKGKHSLLAVTVGDLRKGAVHRYVIEKARTQAGFDGEQFKNGVYVSHWADVSPIIQDDAIHRLMGIDVVNNTGRHDFTMRTLRNLAVHLGPYDVANCNCHHAAMALYNACARDGARVLFIPNLFLTGAARFLKVLGLDVANSESPACESNGLQSQSMASEIYPQFGRFAIVDNGEACKDIWTHHASCFCEWIYNPVSTGTLHLNNLMDEKLVVYVEEARREVRLLPRTSGHVEVGAQRTGEVTVQLRQSRFMRHGRSARVHLTVGRAYCVNKTTNGLSCTPCDALPDGIQLVVLEPSTEGHLVQWSILTSKNAIWIVFRGTKSVFDVIVDLGFFSNDECSHGLRVYSGMWAALNQRKRHVINRIVDEVKKLRAQHSGLDHIIVCGHSLGGGYAILSALAMLHRGIEVTAVRGFGAPQVIVPDWSSPLFRQLHQITTNFVNSYDIVPRMPSCVKWITEALPKSQALAQNWGPITVRVDLQHRLQEAVRGKEEYLHDYDTVGTLAFITQGCRGVRLATTARDKSHRAVLEELPNPIGFFIVEQHYMPSYKAILCQMGFIDRPLPA